MNCLKNHNNNPGANVAPMNTGNCQLGPDQNCGVNGMAYRNKEAPPVNGAAITGVSKKEPSRYHGRLRSALDTTTLYQMQVEN
jgi:hypothetical protein